MRIYTKSLLITGGCIVALICFLLVYTSVVFLGTFTGFEQQEEQKKVSVTLNSLDYLVSGVQKVAYDWGPWDDSYQFVQDNNTRFIEMNLDSGTLRNLDIDYMLFFRQDGSLVYSAGYDHDTGDPVPLDQDLFTGISRRWDLLSQGNGTSGVVATASSPYLVASSRIVPSDLEGERRGTIVLVRRVTRDQVALISNLTGLSLEIEPSPDSSLPPGVLIGEGQYTSLQVNDRLIRTYVGVTGLGGGNAFFFVISSPRPIYESGLSSIYAFIAGLFISGVICLLLMMYLLRVKIFSRLAGLAVKMESIGASQGFHCRVDESGGDEISDLSKSCNTMLVSLDTTAKDLKRAYDRARLYLDVFVYDINNNIMAANGYAALLEEGVTVDTSGIIHQIREILADCTRTIGSVETYENVSGRTPAPVPVSVDWVFERAVSGFERYPVRAGNTRLTVLADDLLPLLVSHLIRNSLEAGGDSTEVSLIATRIPGGMVEVSVEDTGPGIPDSMKEKIFQRFSDSGRSRISNGLGLKIASLLMAAYGGSIRADDRVPGRPEEGAAIRLVLKDADDPGKNESPGEE